MKSLIQRVSSASVTVGAENEAGKYVRINASKGVIICTGGYSLNYDMMEALHTACADFVAELPEGLYTTIDEKGGGLSEGQSQRITIARALLRKRSIMLFDEATSALDPETEKMLLTNILKNKEQTIIFITHRMAVLEYCDKRLNMDDKTNE